MCAKPTAKDFPVNITLSAPDATVLAVRSWAAANHTSLTQFIRDRLEEKVAELQAERNRKADEFARLIRTVRIRVPKGWKFDREEANARR